MSFIVIRNRFERDSVTGNEKYSAVIMFNVCSYRNIHMHSNHML